MLYICIPSYNEAPTIGVLLWRIRKVFQAYSREYEIIVYDDGSTDETRERLAPYAEIAPLTVLRGETRKGYAYAVNKLCREVSRKTRYPRRDAMILMQADFTDQPEHIPEIVKRFEGGADIVLVEREMEKAPSVVRRLQKLGALALKFFVKIDGASDPFNGYRLYRISLLRELIKSLGEKPLVTAPGWSANVELLMHVAPLARRIERMTLPPRYDLRTRETRIRPIADSLDVSRFGWENRGRKVVAAAAPAQSNAAVAAKQSAETGAARTAES